MQILWPNESVHLTAEKNGGFCKLDPCAEVRIAKEPGAGKLGVGICAGAVR
jgi:hypothetical protein